MEKTETSLISDIFGSSEPTSGQNTLSNLFDSSSNLPQQPNHTTFSKVSTDKTDSRKRSRNGDNTEENGEKLTAEKGQERDENEERTIFVGNLPLNTSMKELANMFKGCGEVQSCRIRSVASAGVKVSREDFKNMKIVKKTAALTNKPLENTPKQTSQGYVVFKNIESVTKALKMNNQIIKDGNNTRKLRVDYATPTMDSSRSVFVGNLPYKADEMSLNEHFSNGCNWQDAGVIEGIRLVRDSSTMQCKGIGYILLKDKTFVPDALKMHESQYMGRKLRIMVCGNKKNKPRHRANDGIVKDQGAYRRLKEKPEKKKPKLESVITAPVKEKRKRGTKNNGSSNGVSKRAASSKKLDKRMKKIQKRLSKGMGKAKN